MRGPGSSPRVRGRPVNCLKVSMSPGLIPASAGQTAPSLPRSRSPRAHPRECGADRRPAQSGSDQAGSSPRVRGRQRSMGSSPRSSGLIPASAGQTTAINHLFEITGAHPRECGADESTSMRQRNREGSSPRVRGRLCGKPSCEARSGLIPASAGQTSLTRMKHRKPGAHPRECGADTSCTSRSGIFPGSSPRVRGRQSFRRLLPAGHRLIPASAGQTVNAR